MGIIQQNKTQSKLPIWEAYCSIPRDVHTSLLPLILVQLTCLLLIFVVKIFPFFYLWCKLFDLWYKPPSSSNFWCKPPSSSYLWYKPPSSYLWCNPPSFYLWYKPPSSSYLWYKPPSSYLWYKPPSSSYLWCKPPSFYLWYKLLYSFYYGINCHTPSIGGINFLLFLFVVQASLLLLFVVQTSLLLFVVQTFHLLPLGCKHLYFYYGANLPTPSIGGVNILYFYLWYKSPYSFYLWC